VNTYATDAAFKQALEARLRASSSSGGDFSRRRQLLVFERFLARITREFGDRVMLKGGVVVELRVERARALELQPCSVSLAPERPYSPRPRR
jgi:hypothetical protein